MSKFRAYITVTLMAIVFAYVVLAALPVVLFLLLINAIDPATNDKKLTDVIAEVTERLKAFNEKDKK